jgi:DNA-binding transcriptional regulator LsrR (DeoR family)
LTRFTQVYIILIRGFNDEKQKSVGMDMKIKDERFMMKVVKMYYKNGMSMVDIGKKLNVSRMTIARTLERARNEGYIQIQINYPENNVTNEEEMLEEKFGLREAIVAYPREGQETLDEIGFLTADFIIRMLDNHMVLAITSGFTLQKVAQYLRNDMRLRMKKFYDVKIVPMSGANMLSNTADDQQRLAYSNYLIDMMADILNVSSYQIMVPFFLTDRQVCKKIMEEDSVIKPLKIASNADVAVFGIGSTNSGAMAMNGYPEEMCNRLKEKGGIGEVISHVYDKNGCLVKDTFDEHIIAVSFEDLKKIPIRVGVAYGKEKQEAILGALRGGIVNVLITDIEVAEYLLKADPLAPESE